jgi:CheY-like chemotaxis protein
MSTNRMKVLIIEDYQPTATVTKMYLEHCGYDCDVAKSGLEALKKFQKETYYAVLMDVKMGDFDGYQTTEAIREYEQATSKIPVKIIGVTGLSHARDKQKCLDIGMDDYLCKPYDLSDLREKLTVTSPSPGSVMKH